MVTLLLADRKTKLVSRPVAAGFFCNFSVELGGFGGILRNRQNNYFGGWLIFFSEAMSLSRWARRTWIVAVMGLLVRRDASSVVLGFYWLIFFIFPDRAGKKGLGDRWFFLSSSFFLFAFWRYHANL